ncbi:MAG: HYR domain-containing protein, partial [Flavobacteriales bacterium]|nr:HYR domain-containing protein [Flavobacteriales bacterium]
MAQPTSWNWSRAADSGSDELIKDVAIDPATGDIYAVGSYEAAGPFGLNAPAGSSDGFLVKFDANGTLLWSLPIGGSGEDKAYGVAFDPGGRVYVTGFFRSTLVTLVASTPQSISSLGGADMFLSCFNTSGQLQWMERGGGNGDDMGYAVATNTSGVFVHGVTKGNVTFGNIAITQPNSLNDQIFVTRYPLAGGPPTWLVTGGEDGQDLAGRMAVDASSVHVIGRYEGNTFTWRSATGTAVSSTAASNDQKNGYVARISNTGSILWTRVIDTPSGSEPGFNAIGTDGTTCYIGGRAPAGTVFPGIATTVVSSVQDAMFIAALDASNGNGLWLRTAQGSNSEQTEVFDIATGPAGQVYLSGAYDLNMVWDDGTTHTGSNGRELFVCRMTTTGQLLWFMKEAATGHELPFAIATGAMNKVAVAGAYTQQLRLTPLSYAHGSSTNAFVGLLTDPVQITTTPSAAQWKVMGPICSSSDPIDLNSRLRGYADTWVGSPLDINSQSLALGGPDGTGAIFAVPGANGVLDLGDTAMAGSALLLRVRSQTGGMPSRLETAFSIDGSNWSIFSGNPQVNSATWTDLSITSPVTYRFVRIRLSTSAPNSPFLLDGITYLNETQTGGTWSGPGMSATGIFTPNGLAGWQTITYTVTVSSNPVARSRSIWVSPEPSAAITGTSVVCPGSTGTLLNLTALSPLTSVAGWGTSPDGVNWSVVPGADLSFTTGPITGTLHVMARMFSIGCGARNTPVHLITAIDTTAPVILNCPSATVMSTDPGSCFNNYTFPTLHSTDSCDTDTESDYTAFWLPADQGTWVDVTGWTDVDLAPGTHSMRETHQDDSGNASTCTWTVTVVDNEGPTINCPTNVTPLNVGTSCTAVLPDYSTGASVSDNCISTGGLVYTQVPGPGTLLTPGTHTITLTVTQNGQSATCSFPIIVVDSTLPSITNCPSDLSLSATSSCSAIADWTPPTATDNCTLISIQQITGPAPGSALTVGSSTIVTYRAIDAAGNSSTCSFTITVTDGASPVITCPMDISVVAPTNSCGAVVNYPTPTFSDNCPGSTLTQTAGPVSGSFFPVGSTMITFRVVAANGVTRTCSFWVHVFDQQAPSLTNCEDIVVTAGSNACGAVVSYPMPAMTDNCPACVTGPPANSTYLGEYEGRRYFLRTSATTWGAANSASMAAGGRLAIIRNAGHNAWLRTAVDNVIGTTPTGNARNYWIGLNDLEMEGTYRWTNGTLPTYLNWNSLEPNNSGGNEDHGEVLGSGMWNDERSTSTRMYVIERENNCGSPQVIAGLPSGSFFPVGNTVVSVSASDANGNTAACSFSITVVDQQAPTMVCNNDIVSPTEPNLCGAYVVYPEPAVTDNCPGVVVQRISGPASGSFIPVGQTTIVHSATDASGLTTTCAFVITVVDLSACGCGAPPLGSTCDDGNPNTVNDSIQPNCICAGEPVDCAGIPNGTAFLDNCGTCVGGNTGLIACVADCNGVFGGTAFLDNCNICVGGNTGNTACTQDCAGVWGGTAFLDNCGTCVGGNTSNTACTQDCAGIWGGNAIIDNCGTCVGGNTGNTACTQDCAGVWGGTAVIDNCGTCVGGTTGNTACSQDCAGVWGGTAFLDNCGTCVGGNTGNTACTQDCVGEWGGNAFLDNCGTCVGGNTGLVTCVADCNGVFGGTAFLDNCNTCVGGNTGLIACVADCNGVFGGTAFLDNCGTCVAGNTGLIACAADCNGVFGGTAFLDNCGICVGGNTGNTACSQDCAGVWGGNAFLDNCGTCVGGNTGLVACVADCNGVFGGTAFLDNCGTCVAGNTGLIACAADCNGVFGGTAFLDNCGTCVGGNTGNTACIQDCAGVWGGNAFLDNCGTCVGGNTGLVACVADCNG